jgi:hypothetical protein
LKTNSSNIFTFSSASFTFSKGRLYVGKTIVITPVSALTIVLIPAFYNKSTSIAILYIYAAIV